MNLRYECAIDNFGEMSTYSVITKQINANHIYPQPTPLGDSLFAPGRSLCDCTITQDHLVD